MASKFSFVFVLLVVLCLSVVSFASPIKDVSSTMMAISETKTSNSEHFAVAVQRIDDLVNDNGELLAERIDAVIVNFDLKDDQLLVNNVPVELGVSSFQVIEAQVVPTNIKIEQLEEYADNFDIGLVTVQVSTVAESVPTTQEGVTLRRISITLRIIEIDGISVIQPQDAVEKVLEFKVIELLDGDKDVTVPFYPAEDLSSNNKQLEEHKKSSFQPLNSRIRHWWRCSSRFTRIILASLFLTILFGVFFMAIPASVQGLIMLARRQSSSSRYSAVSFDDDETVVEQVIFIADEEKRALMEQEKELKQ